ncbi:MAG TPA: hypothetical protein VJ725_32685, partial [Thermoanaerobaculia bacterium]|nr:hypothetical protein [Thermoanaerobaculia bacterium]
MTAMESIPERASGPHPTPEQLYRAHRGPRSAEDERWLAHAAVCAACSEELAHLEAFDAPEPVSPAKLDEAWARFGKAPEARRPAPPRRTPALALAAGLAAAVLGLFLWKGMPVEEPERAGLVRGGSEVAGDWQPAGAVAAAPLEIVFPAPSEEPRRVRVFDASGTYSWTSGPVTGGRVPFPETERQRLRPGVEYFWTVLGEDGAAARSFRIQA